MSKRLVTFDLDGTLVDSAPEIELAVARTLRHFALPLLAPRSVVGFIGRGTRELMAQVLNALASNPDERPVGLCLDDVMPVFERIYDEATGSIAQVYAGVPSGLARLSEAGVRIAVVTNKEERFATRLLRATDLLSYFDVVIGGDSLARKKPDPLPIRHVLQWFDVLARDAAHVGDSRIDVETARNAGVAAWAVPYGYNHGEPIARASPEHLFDSVDELAVHVVGDR